MKSARDFLLAVGQDIGRGPEEIEPYICRIVEQEWYDTVESLLEITDMQWSNFGLPGRFLGAIKKKLGTLFNFNNCGCYFKLSPENRFLRLIGRRCLVKKL